MHRAALDRMKHIINVCTRLALHRTAKTLEHGGLAERALWPEIGHRQGGFERATLRHHFGEQLGNSGIAQWSAVFSLQSLQYLSLALGAQHHAILFEMADLLRQRGTLISEFQQLVIQPIDLLAELF